MEVSAIRLVIFITLFLPSTSKDSELPFDIEYVAPSGLKCVKCSPGTYLLRHCSKENTNAQCQLCEDGMYTSDYNVAEYCDMCMTACETTSLVPIRSCTHSSNLVCECPNGTYNLFPNLDKYHAVCQEFDSCQPGYGVQTKGSPTKNTTCVRCIWGRTFSSTTSAVDECQPCTSCGIWGVLSGCTLVQDRKCHRKPPDEHRHSPPENGLGDLKWVLIGVVLGVSLMLIVAVFLLLYRSKRWCFKVDHSRAAEMLRRVIDQSLQYIRGHQQFPNQVNQTNQPTPPSTLSLNPSPPEMPPLTNNQPNANSLGPSCTKIMRKVVDSLLEQGSWKCFIRDLYQEVPGSINANVKINESKSNYPQDVKEQVYQCLAYIYSVGATPDILMKVLNQNTLHVLAAELHQDFPDVFNAGRVESSV